MAEEPATATRRDLLITVSRPPRSPYSEAELKELSELIERVGEPSAESSVEALRGRIEDSTSALGYVLADGDSVPDFVLDQNGAKGRSKLVGFGFLNETTGQLHDLTFDQELIDTLSNPGARADRQVLDLLLRSDWRVRTIHSENSQSSRGRIEDLLRSADFRIEEGSGAGTLYDRFGDEC